MGTSNNDVLNAIIIPISYKQVDVRIDALPLQNMISLDYSMKI